jgi:hypothetical protein
MNINKAKTIQTTYSPNSSTAVTDTTKATTGLDTRSKHKGMLSTATAFARSNVTSNK